MIFSEAFPITIKGKPAQVRVVRNNGYCWGRVIFKDGKEFDVSIQRDHYERIDEEAAASFERAAKRGKLLEPLGSWRIGWAE